MAIEFGRIIPLSFRRQRRESVPTNGTVNTRRPSYQIEPEQGAFVGTDGLSKDAMSISYGGDPTQPLSEEQRKLEALRAELEARRGRR